MGTRLAQLLRPVRFEDSVLVRVATSLALVCILALLWPLIRIHADGMQPRLAIDQQAGQSTPPEPEQSRFQHISPEDGLSEGRVWGIVQDRRGFLWFTSMDGINRYDGREFRVYKYDPANTNSPGSTVYRRVLEDSRGMLWFGSLGEGLSRFDPETEQWTNYRHDPQDPNSLSGDAIWAIAEDQSGGVRIGTEANGLNRFDYDTGLFARYQHDPDDPNSLSANQALAVIVDRSGAV
jgi:ligand-binding sensor domain-containing protein